MGGGRGSNGRGFFLVAGMNKVLLLGELPFAASGGNFLHPPSRENPDI